MAVASVVPEPHLLEKTRMLWLGTLQRPLDIFDLCLHLAPTLFLIWRLFRQFAIKRDWSSGLVDRGQVGLGDLVRQKDVWHPRWRHDRRTGRFCCGGRTLKCRQIHVQ